MLSPEDSKDFDDLSWKLWHPLVARIDSLSAMSEQGMHADVPAASALGGDDRRSRPYQVSHAVSMLLSAGIDNLSGVRHLIFGRPSTEPPSEVILHQAAHYILARGAIENFAAALWILGPAARKDRIHRTFRWHVQNAKDRHFATDRVFGPPKGRNLDDKMKRLRQLVEEATGEIPAKFANGYSATETLRYVDGLVDGRDALKPRFIWQLCSGFGHGRPWATLGFNHQESMATQDPDVLTIRATSSLGRAVVAPQVALDLCERVLVRRELLSRPPWD